MKGISHMSLREKAREVKAAGEEARGDFTPTGAPKRLYKYWLDNASRKSTADLRNGTRKENFCHFWRVVVFWAPFLAFRRGVEALFSNPVFLSVLGVLAVVGIFLAGLTWTEFGAVVLIVLAILYGVAGLIFGGVYADEKWKRDKWKPYVDWDGKVDPYDTAPEIDPISKWGAILTLPASWFTFALVSIANRLDKDTKQLIANGFLALLLGGMAVFLLIVGFVELGWAFLLVLGAIVLGFATLFGIVIGLGKFFGTLRAYNANKPVKVKPEPVVSDEPVTPKVKREPGRISKFFSGIADFLILAAQVVRVNKWKICPLVTIDDAK